MIQLQTPNSELRTFNYDFEDRLTQSNIGGINSQYGYDGLGNRLIRTEGGVTKKYILDINRNLPNVLTETDGGGTITAYYVCGLGLISKVFPNGTTLNYHHDSRGSTIALTDFSQTITDAYAYDSFGKVANSNGPTQNPFKYVGRYGVMDEGNGLEYIRARYYVPEMGRFITKDPVPGELGENQKVNRYTYVENNPTTLIDPRGLWSFGIRLGLSYYIGGKAEIGISSEGVYFKGGGNVGLGGSAGPFVSTGTPKPGWTTDVKASAIVGRNTSFRMEEEGMTGTSSWDIGADLGVSGGEYYTTMLLRWSEVRWPWTKVNGAFDGGGGASWGEEPSTLSISQGNSLRPISSPYTPETIVKGYTSYNTPYIPEIAETQSYKLKTFMK